MTIAENVSSANDLDEDEYEDEYEHARGCGNPNGNDSCDCDDDDNDDVILSQIVEHHPALKISFSEFIGIPSAVVHEIVVPPPRA